MADDTEESQGSILAGIGGGTPQSGPQITASDMKNYNFGMSPQDVMAYNSHHGNLGMQTYYPGFSNGGAVGGYSGSLIGSAALFGGGGALVPMGMLDAQDAAVQHAAMQRKNDLDAFQKQYSKAPTSKLTNINDKLTSGYLDTVKGGWQKALKQAGGDPTLARQVFNSDPELQKKIQSYENLKLMGNDIYDKLAADEVERKSGKFTPTPNYIATAKAVREGLDPDSPQFHDLANNFMKMKMERDVSDSLGEVMKNDLVHEYNLPPNIDTNDPEYLKVVQTAIKNRTPEQQQNYARIMADNHFLGSDYNTYDKLLKDVQHMTGGIQVNTTASVHQKRDDSKDDPDYTENDIIKDPADINGTIQSKLDRDEKGNVVQQFRPAQFRTFDRLTLKTPVNAVIPITKKAVSLDGSKSLDNIGNVNAQLGGVYNTFVVDKKGDPNDGMMVDADNVDKYQGEKNHLAVKTMVSVKFKNGNEDQSVEIPLSEVRTALMGAKGKNKKVIDLIEQRAADATAELKSKSSKAAPAQQAPAAKKDPLGLGL